MKKVKYFTGLDNASVLEKNINDFAKNKNIIQISFVVPKFGNTTYYEALVLYEEEEVKAIWEQQI